MQAAQQVRKAVEHARAEVRDAQINGTSSERADIGAMVMGPVKSVLDEAYSRGRGAASAVDSDQAAATRAVADVCGALDNDPWRSMANDSEEAWGHIGARVASAIQPHIEDGYARGHADTAREEQTKK